MICRRIRRPSGKIYKSWPVKCLVGRGRVTLKLATSFLVTLPEGLRRRLEVKVAPLRLSRDPGCNDCRLRGECCPLDRVTIHGRIFLRSFERISPSHFKVASLVIIRKDFGAHGLRSQGCASQTFVDAGCNDLSTH